MTKLSAAKLQRLASGLGEWPQNLDELQQFLDLINAEGARSYLEIGISHGFTFRFVGCGLPTASRMVGVDHHGVWTPHLVETLAILKERGQDAEMIWGDSKDQEIVQQVRDRGPYDVVFIDGDHSHGGVRADWANYGRMGRIVAFHDIDAIQNREWTAKRISRFGVPSLWAELKQRFRHVEITNKKHPHLGIGVLWVR